MSRTKRAAWVEAEYERIGREREQASREADRQYRWELVRVCLEMFGWTAIGLLIAAFAFHVTDRETGMIFLYGGMLVNVAGVFWSILTAYHRGRARGDW
jgi:FtsH-binding integral membrane protein